jgi:hypothetical protein
MIRVMLYRSCLNSSALLTTLVLLATSPSAAQEAVAPSLFEPLAAFASRDISESSGVAVSRRHPGLLWTHNDSGSDPVLFAVDLAGNELGRFTVTGARSEDWEDIALGPCPEGDSSCLFIGDTGDNDQRRNHVSIYVLPEPDSVGGTRAVAARRIRVRYPEGPQDVEALAVTPSGDLLLITRGRHGPIRTYRIPHDELSDRSIQAARWVDLGIEPQLMVGRLVTGAAVSTDGSTLAVRTYTELYFFDLTGQPGTPRRIGSCWLGLKEPQGEAVDFLDDSTLVFTSEAARGRRGGISRVRCPVYPVR